MVAVTTNNVAGERAATHVTTATIVALLKSIMDPLTVVTTQGELINTLQLLGPPLISKHETNKLLHHLQGRRSFELTVIGKVV